MARRWYDIPEPSTNVVALRPRTNPRHPSMHQPVLFDQQDPDLAAASECVLLTPTEAQAIAGMLRQGRPHSPSPASVDVAIGWLRPKGDAS
jgi:hypothetical protein